MDSFQITVLAIAAVVLIIVLSIIGIALNKLKNKVVYPPIANQCPDYWQIASNQQSCSIPGNGKMNTGNIYSTGSIRFSSVPFVTVPGYSGSTINFNDPGWLANKSAICNKQTWAKSNGIVWDGISNYNSC